MTNEVEVEQIIEENRTKATILAGNPQLYMKLWPEQDDAGIDWQTPETEEELANLVREFESGTVYETTVREVPNTD